MNRIYRTKTALEYFTLTKKINRNYLNVNNVVSIFFNKTNGFKNYF